MYVIYIYLYIYNTYIYTFVIVQSRLYIYIYEFPLVDSVSPTKWAHGAGEMDKTLVKGSWWQRSLNPKPEASLEKAFRQHWVGGLIADETSFYETEMPSATWVCQHSGGVASAFRTASCVFSVGKVRWGRDPCTKSSWAPWTRQLLEWYTLQYWHFLEGLPWMRIRKSVPFAVRSFK